MTREEAIKKALELSVTGEVSCGDSYSRYFSKGNNEYREYTSYAVHIDGLCAVGEKSYKACLDRLSKDIEGQRAKRAAELRRELEALEGKSRGGFVDETPEYPRHDDEHDQDCDYLDCPTCEEMRKLNHADAMYDQMRDERDMGDE
jgi:hypothetical protein